MHPPTNPTTLSTCPPEAFNQEAEISKQKIKFREEVTVGCCHFHRKSNCGPASSIRATGVICTTSLIKRKWLLWNAWWNTSPSPLSQSVSLSCPSSKVACRKRTALLEQMPGSWPWESQCGWAPVSSWMRTSAQFLSNVLQRRKEAHSPECLPCATHYADSLSHL